MTGGDRQQRSDLRGDLWCEWQVIGDELISLQTAVVTGDRNSRGVEGTKRDAAGPGTNARKGVTDDRRAGMARLGAAAHRVYPSARVLTAL